MKMDEIMKKFVYEKMKMHFGSSSFTHTRVGMLISVVLYQGFYLDGLVSSCLALTLVVGNCDVLYIWARVVHCS